MGEDVLLPYGMNRNKSGKNVILRSVMSRNSLCSGLSIYDARLESTKHKCSSSHTYPSKIAREAIPTPRPNVSRERQPPSKVIIENSPRTPQNHMSINPSLELGCSTLTERSSSTNVWVRLRQSRRRILLRNVLVLATRATTTFPVG
jgi:hypothetical protein